VRSEIPGRDKEVVKTGEEWGQKAGSKVDSAVSLMGLGYALSELKHVFTLRSTMLA
jgi:hypothetical protein